MKQALKVVVTGIVQGVGFRPFIYRIAMKSRVRGYVKNVGGSEVEIFIESNDKGSLSTFLHLLLNELPPPAVIEELIIEPSNPKGFASFKILKSGVEVRKYSMIPPDFSICDDCLAEVLNPEDRRFRYAFNSCAWCGPRFSMMYMVPYDRENTSMVLFKLCDECLSEYRDPNNVRRFHAQGISCPKCGPSLRLVDRYGNEVITKDPMREVAKLIDEGSIVAIKGLGGFHIACLATDDDVVLKLRKRKNRPQKPFAIMALNLETLDRLVYIDERAKEVLTSPTKPIVLLPKKENSPVSKWVSPGLKHEGVFLPYTALHYLILSDVRDKFAIMTSGNPHGKPMCIDEECAFRYLSQFVDYFLLHNREIVNRVDDSVVRFTDGELVLIRRGRGYAPKWFHLPFKLRRPVIAFGAELQTAGAVAFNDKVIVTQYIGDIDDYDVLEDLDKYLKFFIRTYNIDVSSAYLVIDKHPYYTSRKLAEIYSKRYGSELIEVQHHYSHLLSAAVSRKLGVDEDFIGIAIDSVGFGDDGNIWGGEVLHLNYEGYRRVGHLQYHPLPGGDITIRYPARMLISILNSFMSEEEVMEFVRKRGLSKYLRHGMSEVRAVLKQIKRIRVMTSSIGRVLDSISTLLGICWVRTYEGEPAIKLEEASYGGRLIDGVETKLMVHEGNYVVSTARLFETLLENLDRDVKDLAYTSLYVLGYALGDMVKHYVKGLGVNTVLISGGAAVNTVIVRGVKEALGEVDIYVKLPKDIPPNDGGIALGQVAATYRFNAL